jgi:hypothetical protein
MFAYMAERLSADARSMTQEEEIATRRGALKLLLMNQAGKGNEGEEGTTMAGVKGRLPWRSQTASADEARFAICPITVLSPVRKQIPLPEPAVHDVPKKPTFLVSNIF